VTGTVANPSPADMDIWPVVRPQVAASSEFHQHIQANLDKPDPSGMLKPPLGTKFLAAVDVEPVPG
jgi:hypothetical protein